MEKMTEEIAKRDQPVAALLVAIAMKESKFGKYSMALRFNQKPVFVFNLDSPVDEKFLSQICEIYLTISEKRNNRAPVKSP
jgi:hypothetical protein